MVKVNLCLHPRLNNGGMYGGLATVAGTVECNDMGYWRFLPCFKTGVSSPRLIMKRLSQGTLPYLISSFLGSTFGSGTFFGRTILRTPFSIDASDLSARISFGNSKIRLKVLETRSWQT